MTAPLRTLRERIAQSWFGRSGQGAGSQMSMPEPHRPDVSVVVVIYNMAREAPRTLHSLSAAYQRHIDADDYEVIVVDNGSQPSFDAAVLDGLAGHSHLSRTDGCPAKAYVPRSFSEARYFCSSINSPRFRSRIRRAGIPA